MARDSLAGVRRWILLDGERKAVAAGALAVTFLVVYGLVAIDLVGVARVGPIRTLFGSIVTGVFTVVSIVLSINQVVLSRVFGSPDELTDRMSASMEFHRDVEEHTEIGTAPTNPDSFLEALIEGLGDRSRKLRRQTDEEAIVDYAADVEAHAEDIEERFGNDEYGMSDVLSTVLHDDYSEHIQRARELEAKDGNELSADARETFGDIVSILQDIGVMRQYFETIYVQQELASLSRALLSLGFPALVIAALVILLYAQAGGPPLSPELLEFTVSAALTVTLAPLAIVLAVIFRVATIARLTTALGPFTPPAEAD
jgi:hypothetical protein